MRKSMRVIAFLGTTGLAACSGAPGQGPGGDVSSTPPPPPPPPPPATPPPPTGAEPSAPQQGALTCSPCKKIVFMSGGIDQDGSSSEIYTINADGTGLTRLTNNQSYDGEPAWSPDGQRIAFVSGRDFGPNDADRWKRVLYVMDADGSNVRRLTVSTGGAWNPAWSPDGGRIVYEAIDGGSDNLWEVPADGGAAKLLFSTPGVDMQPAWSPDGTRLALVSDWVAYDFVLNIYLINADGSGFTAVTDAKVFDQRDYLEPAWSPDGSRIALVVSDRLGTWEYATHVGLMNASGSGVTLLPGTDGTSVSGAGVGSPSWSPDGTMIAYTACDDGQCDIRWIKADGSEYGDIVRNAMHPDWQR
jgi:TolB protein